VTRCQCSTAAKKLKNIWTVSAVSYMSARDVAGGNVTVDDDLQSAHQR